MKQPPICILQAYETQNGNHIMTSCRYNRRPFRGARVETQKVTSHCGSDIRTTPKVILGNGDEYTFYMKMSKKEALSLAIRTDVAHRAPKYFAALRSKIKTLAGPHGQEYKDMREQLDDVEVLLNELLASSGPELQV